MEKRLYLYVLFILTPFLNSCINEYLPLCPESGVNLQYYYILNPHSTEEREVNLFGSDIHKMNIYIFDENDLFYDFVLIDEPWKLQDDNQIFLPLPPGKYTIVSWGGSTSLGSQNDSYEVLEAIDPSDVLTFNPYLTKGVTTLQNFRLMLKDDHPEDLTHVKNINTPANLYYGDFKKVESAVDAVTGATVAITKNTNLINVRIGGISNLTAGLNQKNEKMTDQFPIDIYITARNGRYLYDNSIGEYARTVKYEQEYQILHPDTLLVPFTVLRLMENDKTSRVILENSNSRSEIISLDIVPTIIKADERINGQHDLDKHDVYDIRINFEKNLSVAIWVNGWLYNTIYPGI